MPGLRVVTRAGTPTLYVRGTVGGRTVFESAGTSNRAWAEEYRAKREAELYKVALYGERAVVTFADAAQSYLEAERRRPDTARRVAALIGHFGPMRLSAINQVAVDRAYKVLLTPKAGNATKQRAVLTPLSAIFKHAAERDWCARPAFASLKIAKPRTAFLRPEEAARMVAVSPPHFRPLLVFLIGTGCRLSEALELEWPQVDLQGARVVVDQKQDTQRQVDLPPAVLLALAAQKHRSGHVFRKATTRRQQLRGEPGDPYRDTGRDSSGQIKGVWGSVCRAAGLAGEARAYQYAGRTHAQRRFKPVATPHTCRHTWASWHYCVHRDLLRLRDDGGWSTVSMVERYAKLMPTVYREAVLDWWSGAALRAPDVQRASAQA